MSSKRETFWTLPLAICLELDADQQDFIRDCIYDYEQRTKRTARAKMSSFAGEASAITSLPREPPGDGGYIKPSAAAASEPAVAHPSRPVSVFPPEIIVTGSPDRSSARRSDDVEYRCMTGVRSTVTNTAQ